MDVTSIDGVTDPSSYVAKTYKGIGVFPGLHNAFDDIPEVYPRRGQAVDSVTGAKAFDDWAGQPFPTRTLRWIADSRANALAMRTWLTNRQGRRNAFWLPTCTWDMQYVANFGSLLYTRGYGYVSDLFPNLSRAYLAIYPNGLTTVYFCKVTAADEVVASVGGVNVTCEELTLDTTPPAFYYGRTKICFLTLCRLANDDFTIDWNGLNYASFTIPVVEVPLEVPA